MVYRLSTDDAQVSTLIYCWYVKGSSLCVILECFFCFEDAVVENLFIVLQALCDMNAKFW